MGAPHPVLTVITTPEGHTRLPSGSSPKMQSRNPRADRYPLLRWRSSNRLQMWQKMWQANWDSKGYGENTKHFASPSLQRRKFHAGVERKTENSSDRACFHAELLALRGLLANSSTIRASLSTINAMWHLKSCYKGTSKQVLLHFMY